MPDHPSSSEKVLAENDGPAGQAPRVTQASASYALTLARSTVCQEERRPRSESRAEPAPRKPVSNRRLPYTAPLRKWCRAQSRASDRSCPRCCRKHDVARLKPSKMRDQIKIGRYREHDRAEQQIDG